ncbi:MAG: membrane protein insertion efficiency factor YidD [Lentisphaeria bacterium]|nr:membrane protein insertion efficiency factor YidD [Lentisphaeria bacterium]
MAFILKLPSKILLLLVRFYQLCLSPFIPSCCRFTPTCSAYAADALKLHGAIKGCILSMYRIGRCQPLCKGGHDPVPEKFVLFKKKN